ncbi:hypothetical protein [Paraburkholderia heleia]|uniref:hypothetical protein n=1 Tax=Paraburkholderia heleia TaxID=634127 RepID=UPI0012ED639A|nr:hypothetical protein [Paraburkholderia heleia]
MSSSDIKKDDKPLEGFLKQAAQYKEFIAIIAGLVVTAFFVRDYFATKEEVRVLQCQAENGIALVENKVNAEDSKTKILAIQRQINDAIQRGRNQKGVAAQAASETIMTLNLDLDQLKTDLASANAAQATAISNLTPGVCDGKATSK